MVSRSADSEAMQHQEMIGQVVGDYQLVEVLGEGGMGVVYKGVDVRFNQPVALKALHPALMADPQLRERFVREAQALARLNHPNVVRLLNFIDRGDTCFIVMEFIQGRTIEQIMQQTGLIPPERAADIFVQVLAAAHYAHSLGIIHRDIKPANIAVLDSGQVKLLDFGTAKVVDAQRLTQANMTLGTLVYMSPEQVCGRDLDHRSDIYSLGVTLYEMVTGHLPYETQSETELFRAIVKEAPTPPSVHYPPLPRELERIILRAIEKDPARRFQTAEEMLVAIRGFLKSVKQEQAKQTPPSGVHLRAVLAGPAGGGEAVLADGLGAVFAGPQGRALAMAGGGVGLAALGGVVGGATGAGWLAVVCGLLGAGTYGLGVWLAARPRARSAAAVGAPAGERLGEATLAQDESLELPPGGRMHAGAAPPPPPEARAVVGASPAGAADGWAAPQPEAEEGSGSTAAPAATAILYVFEGPDQGQSWVLPRGAITIGRGEHNSIVLHDSGVSGSHAQIGFDGRNYVITDLESRNGTYVNNRRVKTAVLNDRDVIVLGTSKLAIAFQ
ncbi:MAG: hypothetical protein KatS3mg102_2066 [Planctomycetota bacterium]|nr:MAG: hypothetical protein KatS3mg102_2066 [Planctomycetota bacterium]